MQFVTHFYLTAESQYCACIQLASQHQYYVLPSHLDEILH